MKKIHLQKIVQHGIICYIGKIDPRSLVRVATKIEMSTVQDAQRPLNEKRVKDIAAYVASDGLSVLPNTLTIATKDDRFLIKKDDYEEFYYIDFPETESEFENYLNAIDVMDGQHRLYSFLPSIRQISDDENFEIGFTMYERPTLEERRRIFVSCNEKQEKVSGNLLMWFKSQLQMLSDDERMFYGIVSKLSNEFPLKGHIIMSAEKIKNGVKAKEVIAALKQAKVQDMSIGGRSLTDEETVKVICTYLAAWQSVVGFSFSTSGKKEAGPAVTMAGLKYMLILLPVVWERAVNLRRKFDQQFIEDTLKLFIQAYGIARDEFFTCEEHKFKFRDRTVSDAFANEGVIKMKALGSEDYNPLG